MFFRKKTIYKTNLFGMISNKIRMFDLFKAELLPYIRILDAINLAYKHLVRPGTGFERGIKSLVDHQFFTGFSMLCKGQDFIQIFIS